MKYLPLLFFLILLLPICIANQYVNQNSCLNESASQAYWYSTHTDCTGTGSSATPELIDCKSTSETPSRWNPSHICIKLKAYYLLTENSISIASGSNQYYAITSYDIIDNSTGSTRYIATHNTYGTPMHEGTWFNQTLFHPSFVTNLFCINFTAANESQDVCPGVRNYAQLKEVFIDNFSPYTNNSLPSQNISYETPCYNASALSYLIHVNWTASDPENDQIFYSVGDFSNKQLLTQWSPAFKIGDKLKTDWCFNTDWCYTNGTIGNSMYENDDIIMMDDGYYTWASVLGDNPLYLNLPTASNNTDIELDMAFPVPVNITISLLDENLIAQHNFLFERHTDQNVSISENGTYVYSELMGGVVSQYHFTNNKLIDYNYPHMKIKAVKIWKNLTGLGMWENEAPFQLHKIIISTNLTYSAPTWYDHDPNNGIIQINKSAVNTMRFYITDVYHKDLFQYNYTDVVFNTISYCSGSSTSEQSANDITSQIQWFWSGYLDGTGLRAVMEGLYLLAFIVTLIFLLFVSQDFIIAFMTSSIALTIVSFLFNSPVYMMVFGILTVLAITFQVFINGH